MKTTYIYYLYIWFLLFLFCFFITFKIFSVKVPGGGGGVRVATVRFRVVSVRFPADYVFDIHPISGEVISVAKIKWLLLKYNKAWC